jgi:hypothetical protein
MGFLSSVGDLVQIKGPPNINVNETFYGSTLAGSDVSAFEMAEEEVCLECILSAIALMGQLDVGQKRVPLYQGPTWV